VSTGSASTGSARAGSSSKSPVGPPEKSPAAKSLAKLSAGLLVYRVTGAGIGIGIGIEVLLVHPGGPFWAKKDDGAWSIPKGELDDDERAAAASAAAAASDGEAAADKAAYAAAIREFEEEIGQPAPTGEAIDLGEVRQRSGKVVRAWGMVSSPGEIDAASIRSNEVELEWPRGSGRRIRFPEVDRAEWMSPETARSKLVSAQVTLLDRLVEFVAD
jgi:predicted NUDIX family NTP pyrophosphohydrolase